MSLYGKKKMDPIASWDVPTQPISIITAESLEIAVVSGSRASGASR